MRYLKKLFDFYINSSLHVALSVYALVQLTQILFGIYNDNTTAYFAFLELLLAIILLNMMLWLELKNLK